MAIEVDEEMQRIAERLVSLGMAAPEEIVGCTEAEVHAAELFFGRPLPPEYAAFLRIMGRGAGALEGEVRTGYPPGPTGGLYELASVAAHPASGGHTPFLLGGDGAGGLYWLAPYGDRSRVISSNDLGHIAIRAESLVAFLDGILDDCRPRGHNPHPNVPVIPDRNALAQPAAIPDFLAATAVELVQALGGQPTGIDEAEVIALQHLLGQSLPTCYALFLRTFGRDTAGLFPDLRVRFAELPGFRQLAFTPRIPLGVGRHVCIAEAGPPWKPVGRLGIPLNAGADPPVRAEVPGRWGEWVTVRESLWGAIRAEVEAYLASPRTNRPHRHSLLRSLMPVKPSPGPDEPSSEDVPF